MRGRRRFAWFVAAVMLATPALAQDGARAWQNLRLVLSGGVGLGSLSSEERAEVAIAARELRRREKTAGLTAYERCRLANLSDDPPTKLEEAAIDLKCSQR